MVPYRKDAPAHMPFSTNFEFKQIIKFESFIMLGRTFCNMYNKQIKSSFVLDGCVLSTNMWILWPFLHYKPKHHTAHNRELRGYLLTFPVLQGSSRLLSDSIFKQGGHLKQLKQSIWRTMNSLGLIIEKWKLKSLPTIPHLRWRKCFKAETSSYSVNNKPAFMPIITRSNSKV